MQLLCEPEFRMTKQGNIAKEGREREKRKENKKKDASFGQILFNCLDMKRQEEGRTIS